MKKILLSLFVVIACNVCTNAQSATINQIKSTNKQHPNITCKFTQEHHIVAINKIEKLNGTLYYTASNKMAMHYTVPASNLFIINANQLYMVTKNRKNLFNLQSNATMNQLASLLLSSMAGDINSIAQKTGAKVSYAKEGNHHVFTLTKEKKAAKGYKRVVLKYNTKNLLLEWMKLEEFNGNYNTYALSGQNFGSINSNVYKISK